jgi:hypothetical protein
VSGSSLKLPEKTVSEQEQSKKDWNSKHCVSQPDFYTIGYSGKKISDFIDIIKNAGVATLVDVRFSPVSRFKPEFSKNNLKRLLEANGIQYIHRPEWGVHERLEHSVSTRVHGMIFGLGMIPTYYLT